CSSVREFASSFLQIPFRNGHPCFQLTVPTAKPVVDFHHQVIAHAGRTKKPRPYRQFDKDVVGFTWYHLTSLHIYNTASIKYASHRLLILWYVITSTNSRRNLIIYAKFSVR